MKHSTQTAITVALMICATVIIARSDDTPRPPGFENEPAAEHCAGITVGQCRRRLADAQRERRSEAALDICRKRFAAGELQPGDEIGACYAKATNNRCDGSLDGATMQACTDWVDDHLKPKPVVWRPWQQVWQCNDIRMTITSRQQGIIEYDLGGTIWGGSRFAVDLRHGETYYFNGRPCVPLR